MATTRVSLNRLTHVHVLRTSRDCDGRYDHDYVVTPREGETFRELWTDYAMRRVDVTWNYNVRVERSTHEDGTPYVQYSADTDEGYEYEETYGCDHKRCIPGTQLFRDHTAESMGY